MSQLMSQLKNQEIITPFIGLADELRKLSNANLLRIYRKHIWRMSSESGKGSSVQELFDQNRVAKQLEKELTSRFKD